MQRAWPSAPARRGVCRPWGRRAGPHLIAFGGHAVARDGPGCQIWTKRRSRRTSEDVNRNRAPWELRAAARPRLSLRPDRGVIAINASYRSGAPPSASEPVRPSEGASAKNGSMSLDTPIRRRKRANCRHNVLTMFLPRPGSISELPAERAIVRSARLDVCFDRSCAIFVCSRNLSLDWPSTVHSPSRSVPSAQLGCAAPDKAGSTGSRWYYLQCYLDRSARLQVMRLNCWISWSGRPDSNGRPSAPKADALPDCATPRVPEPKGSAARAQGRW